MPKIVNNSKNRGENHVEAYRFRKRSNRVIFNHDMILRVIVQNRSENRKPGVPCN